MCTHFGRRQSQTRMWQRERERENASKKRFIFPALKRSNLEAISFVQKLNQKGQKSRAMKKPLGNLGIIYSQICQTMLQNWCKIQTVNFFIASEANRLSRISPVISKQQLYPPGRKNFLPFRRMKGKILAGGPDFLFARGGKKFIGYYAQLGTC